MKHNCKPHSRRATQRRFRGQAGIGSLATALLLAACGGGSGGGSETTGLAPGAVTENPATGLSFVIDANQGGGAKSLLVQGLFWGRLVNVLDVDRDVIFRDFVIGDDIKSDGVNYKLERNPVTEVETLVILHQEGTPQFEAAFLDIDRNVQNVLDKGLGANVLPPFTMVARNSALVLRFNDLLNDGGDPGDPNYPGTVLPDTIKVQAGYPPTTPYELRVIPDPCHGDLVSGQFHSTRVILDLTVSKLEAQVLSLPINSLGLPGAITTQQPNLAVRVPSRVHQAAAQFQVLRNLSGNSVSFAGNGSTDPFSPTLDVVRAARSGGTVTGDPNNGFLFDEIQPEIVGAQGVTVFVTGGTPPAGSEHLVDVHFASVPCATRPRLGDIIELPAHTLEVTQASSSPINGVVKNVPVNLLVGDPATLISNTGQYRTVWDSVGGALPECFFRFSPGAGTSPNQNVVPGADVIVSFSEPMDPGSVTAFDTFTLEYGKNPNGINPIYQRVVGNVLPSVNLLEFTFEPSLPLRNHGNPQLPPESYAFTVRPDDQNTPNVTEGVTDLAGNPLRVELPSVQFFIDPSQPLVDSASVSLAFDGSNDEDLNMAPDIRGQFLISPTLGLIRPRAVQHFSAQADPTQPIPGSMVQIQLPIVTPLSNFGSRMMGLWRYFDLGFTLLDVSNHNLDVEGLWWEPYGGSVLPDFFSGFELTLSHSRFLPDEDLTTGLLPKLPSSGLVNTFSDNHLETVTPGTDPPVVMHGKSEGYQIQPIDMIPSPNGRNVVPWPVNRSKAPADFSYWTWRDTSVLTIAGPKGSGADPQVLKQASPHVQFYGVNKVPTIALPMLMDFKTWPETTASGQNGFQVAIAINSSARPYFRTFSSGGALNSGQIINIIPDQQVTGAGGVNPINGNNTPPQDNSFYFGQVDFVVRVSRVHTMWFDTLGSSNFASNVIEPIASQQPTGTGVSLAFRGATGMSNTSGFTPWEDAGLMDPYGDGYTQTQLNKLSLPTNLTYKVTYLVNKRDWRTNLTDLNGARYVQVRATMLSNPETALTPVLSALGIAFIH